MTVASPHPPHLVSHECLRQSEQTRQSKISLTTHLYIDFWRQALPYALCQDGRVPEGRSHRWRRQGHPDSRNIVAETLQPWRQIKVGVRCKGGRQHGGDATAESQKVQIGRRGMLTDKNVAAKRGQKADEEIKQKGRLHGCDRHRNSPAGPIETNRVSLGWRTLWFARLWGLYILTFVRQTCVRRLTLNASATPLK